jgi:excisionase family DNA binding protein
MTKIPPSPNEGVERLAYSMEDAAKAAGVSRSFIYTEAAAGRLVTRKLGKRRLVHIDDLNAWIKTPLTA